MAKKSYLLIATLFIFGLVIIVLVTEYEMQKHQAFLERRHHLLCEVLRPGMSKDEVISILRQSGDFTIHTDNWSNGDIDLYVYAEDPHTNSQYDSFTLEFINYKYERAYIWYGSDAKDIYMICDFYPTPSKLETPTPVASQELCKFSEVSVT